MYKVNIDTHNDRQLNRISTTI